MMPSTLPSLQLARRLLVLLLLAIGLPAAPRAEEARAGGAPAPPSLGNVWCIGDSWSVCVNGATWRRPLCQALVAEGWSFDFVGTLRTDRRCADKDYDRDHNAIGGITAREVREVQLDEWIQSVHPDVVLLLLGGNDVVGRPGKAGEALLDLRGIIDRIRIQNPNAAFHVATYGYVDINIPDVGVDMLALALQGLVTSSSTPESPVYFVDHRRGWDKAIHLDPVDKFHPTPEGMAHMARRWHESIVAHHRPPTEPAPLPAPEVEGGTATPGTPAPHPAQE